MKAQIITITLFASIILSSFYSNAQTELFSFESHVAEIYNGNIEDSADYIAVFTSTGCKQKILLGLRKEDDIAEIKRGRCVSPFYRYSLRRNK